MNAAIKQRILLWGAVPVLAAVLVLLAVLQYRWSGQVSAATRSQMELNLHVAMMGFRQDLARELAAIPVELRGGMDDSGKPNAVRLSQQFRQWQQGAAHPALVSHMYFWTSSDSDHLLSLDPSREQMQAVPWPANFDRLRQRLNQTSLQPEHLANPPQRPPQHNRTERSHSHGRDPSPIWLVDESIPAILRPMRPRQGAMPPQALTWIIIPIELSVVEKEVLPELAQKYLTGSPGLDYRVAVLRTSGDKQEVLYSSEAGFGANAATPMDGALNLFGPPTRHGQMPPMPGMFAVSRSPGNERTLQTQAGERSVRFEPLFFASDDPGWQIVVQHKKGSLDAAVSGLRWRNLIVSFGVLVVLAITMALVVITSQRARRLALLQMEFVAGVSHELRTPLAVISSAAENIAHGVVAEKEQVARYGASILKQSRQLTKLVEQVLVFAATQQKPQRYQLRPLNVAEVIDAALENTANMITGGAVTLERHIEAGLPPVAADFSALTQCLQNLINNAVKYGGESRWIGIRATAQKEKDTVREVSITVQDHGIGIGPGELKQIFDPFYRSPAVAGSNIHGTGLGLPLAKTLIESMRGRLTVESEVGKGARFTIHLPVADGPETVTAKSAIKGETSTATS